MKTKLRFQNYVDIKLDELLISLWYFTKVECNSSLFSNHDLEIVAELMCQKMEEEYSDCEVQGLIHGIAQTLGEDFTSYLTYCRLFKFGLVKEKSLSVKYLAYRLNIKLTVSLSQDHIVQISLDSRDSSDKNVSFSITPSVNGKTIERIVG
ncbi:hypothetical protein D6810_01600 [Candidatus Dojkabacteria bacterium]|uniref:Uncharacterized protein n=1 Tax=Candidatus Dojkabacteria bacterium TaxID=2099670 RepID=A0A3M0Z0D2_9BACT|nr:MAG: hypothetical protein D6810_01600 [Candidatus Dojkabacteria bacterium]